MDEQLIDKVAETIWQAEHLRVRGTWRTTTWPADVSEEDRGRYRFIAKEVIPVVLAQG